MHWKTQFFWTALLLNSLPLLGIGAIYHQIDTAFPLKCVLSAKHHNRLLVEKGRIKKILFPEEKLHINLEEYSGQIFLSSRQKLAEEITVSIVTESGFVQDLEIQFADKPMEVVILRENIESHECENENNASNNLTTYIDTILRGNIPPGFNYEKLEYEEFIWKNGCKVFPLKQFANGEEVLKVYQINNKTFSKKHFSESEFSTPSSKWVYLEKNSIRSKEKIIAIVCEKT